MTQDDVDDSLDGVGLADLSQELDGVEWFGISDPVHASLSHGLLGRAGAGRHAAGPWTSELALVVLGALIGAVLYFWRQ